MCSLRSRFTEQDNETWGWKGPAIVTGCRTYEHLHYGFPVLIWAILCTRHITQLTTYVSHDNRNHIICWSWVDWKGWQDDLSLPNMYLGLDISCWTLFALIVKNVKTNSSKPVSLIECLLYNTVDSFKSDTDGFYILLTTQVIYDSLYFMWKPFHVLIALKLVL